MPQAPPKKGQPLAWLGVMFECCNVYRRIFKRKDGEAYEGHCPRCRRFLRVPIGDGGTSQRIFRAR
jgi:hypothetical protein